MFLYALQSENISGIYNAVAPNPVTNKQLIDSIAFTKGGFFIKIPVPAFALKLALGEMSIEILKSTTVSSAHIIQSGFTFQYPTVDKALKQLLG
jgi:hypothetical protein